MRKLFSFIMVALMSIMTLNAETTRIYCKMAQDWWKVDNAAVGCHSWGTPGPGTDWPGVRMTPVEGETDLWYIDLDVTKVQNVIFTRVNASGAIADWGAKTKDLTIPTNGDNLFTITTSDESWGDPGCEGEWSKYDAPVPTEPTVTDITITGDKYVGTELTFTATVAGFSAEPMVIYEVISESGDYNKQAQGGKFTPTAAGNYTVKATAFYQPDDGDAEEAFKEVAFTVTEAPKVGITVNVTVPAGTPACYFYGEMSGNTFVEMTKVDETHYTTEFSTATTIGWGYLFAWEAGNWSTKNAEGDFTEEPKDGVINVEVKAWTTAPTPVETKYYITGNAALVGEDKAWHEDAIEMNGTSYTFTELAAGSYQLKVTNGTWEHFWGYSDLSKTISTEGLTTDENDNICFTVYTPNDVTINISDGHILGISGNFKPQPAQTFDLTIVQDTLWSSVNAKVAAWIWGEELAGEWTAWATNVNDTLTLKVDERADSIIFKRFAPEVEVPYWEGTAEYQWNEIAKSEIADCQLFIITNWNEGVWCERPVVETKYYAKNNWNNGDWTWLEMTKVEDLYVLDSVIFGGTGVNINTKEEDADAKWFDLKKMKYNEQDTIQALDTVRFELAIDDKDTVLTAILLGRPAPVARKEFVFVAGEVADSDPAMFAITWDKDGSSETVKMEKQEEALYAADILATVDSVVLVRCATGATEIIRGEGTNVWNQTANYALCDTMYFESWVPETNLFTLTCEAPKPVETKYYIKNNWDGAASDNWSWKEMTQGKDEFEWEYTGVVGNLGVNISTSTDDPEPVYYSVENEKLVAIVGSEEIGSLDTVTFYFDSSEDDVVAYMVTGKYKKPEPVKQDYYLVGYINGAASGCEDDWENFHEEYKFVNGSLTTTFTQTSYVFVKTGDNQHWYLSESYVAPAAQVTATLTEGNTEKVGVNANVEVTFTLTENADGTVTLSYKEAIDPSALENIMQNSGLKKFILNGQMYIQHNDRLYNAAGFLLK